MTIDNLTAVLDSVQGNMDWVTNLLQIPPSKQSELQRQYDSRQVNRAYAEYFISHNPSPSWRTVANALWEEKQPGALEMVQKLYLKGEPCAHSYRREGRMLSVSEFLVVTFCTS